VTALVSAELLKLRTTRAWIGYVLGLIALAVLGSAATTSVLQRGAPEYTLDVVSSARIAGLVAFLVGITTVTSEWRHGTITRTFLTTPRRERVLLSKELTAVLLGIWLAVVALAVVLTVASIRLMTQDARLDVDGVALKGMGQVIAETALWAALGVGVGAIIQSQTVALVVGILWVLLAETLVAVLLDVVDQEGIADYLAGRALGALGGADGGLHPVTGGAVGLGWVVALGLLGAVRMGRKDVT
jgi:ABC-2 type transport system permease protein